MATTMTRSRPSLQSCPPRFATRRRPERPTFGHRLAKIAELLGQPFMPWQRFAADVGCEIDPATGYPAYREVGVTVPRQSGKGLSEDTPLPTPDGWVRMGDVRVGDALFDEHGERCRVAFVSERRWLDCYRVSFSDGTSVVADGDHLWHVFDVWASGGSRKKKGAWRTLETRAMVGRAAVGTRGKSESRYRLPDVGPLDCADAILPIDPYVLGVWLGDGTTAGGSVTVGDDDIAEVVALLENVDGHVKSLRQDDRTGAWLIRLAGLQAALRRAGLLGNKHVPGAYLRASAKQRLALLQGLMDSDGTVGVNGDRRTNRRCEFSVVDERLARDFAELARSLGIRVSFKSSPARLRGRTVGTRYRVAFTTDFPVFRLSRKAERHAEQGSLRKRSRMVTSVERVPTVPTRCIQVDAPSSLFRCGQGMVPTHNTTTTLTWQGDRCLNWGRPQLTTFTAQSGKDARDKWIDELFPLLRTSKLAPLIKRINEGIANESVIWKTGSRIRLGSTSASAGHGRSLHQAVLDEIWHDADERREQSLRPAMVTVPDAQIIWASTAGTQASTVYNRKRAAGRLAAAEDTGHGVAYFEWSAPDDWDPADEDSWWTFMPALGFTITPEVIRTEQTAMKPEEFRRAYGNLSTGSLDLVIPTEVWQRATIAKAKPEGALHFGADVAEDRSSAAIVATDGVAFELVDHRPGTAWVIERCNQLTAAHGGSVAIDFKGPAGVLADGVERCRRLTSEEVIHACSAMYDAIIEARVSFRQCEEFDAAVGGVVKKHIADRFVWSRKASTADVTPLMAATLALFQARGPSTGMEPLVAVTE